MSDTKVDGRFSFPIEVRMIFPNLYEPKAVMRNGKPTGEPKHGARYLIPVTNETLIAAIKAKITEVARAKWPGVDMKTLKLPLVSGEKEAEKSKAKGKDGSFYTGQIVITGRSKYAPRLSVFQGKAGPQELEGVALAAAKNKFYSGCWCVPQFNFVAYDGVGEDGKPGVAAYLDQVLWVKDGQRIGAPSAAEAFKGYQGSVSTENPLGASELDDEIPFDVGS